jgi:hypothetical protein
MGNTYRVSLPYPIIISFYSENYVYQRDATRKALNVDYQSKVRSCKEYNKILCKINAVF